MKLWIDDVRPAPEGYTWCKSVNEAKYIITHDGVVSRNNTVWYIELIDIDHDGGDYIKLLDWLEETGRNYPIHIHSMNAVGVQNMRAIIKRNSWKEI